MADRLTIYNGALGAIGDRRLLSTTENRETRRELDGVWDRGAVRTCLSHGLWKFAMRAAQWLYSPDFAPPFGFKRAFNHPADWIRWAGVCEDEFFNVPLTRYMDEAGYLFCDLDMIYVRWISDDPQWGMNLALWPDGFQRYVELYFASKVAMRLTNSQKVLDAVNKDMDAALKRAKSNDAMEDPTQFLPVGTWSQARRGRRTWGGDRGSRNQLIG